MQLLSKKIIRMDILYLSQETASELHQYCERRLLAEVMEHFAKNGKIVNKDYNGHPSRLWDITEYINDDTIEYRKKLSVILSFAAIAGFVQIGDRVEQGDVNTLIMLKECKRISEEDWVYFIDAFHAFSCGEGTKFDI